MIWNIVADSSSDLKELKIDAGSDEIRYYSVPFVVTSGGRHFVDDENLDIEDMLTTMEHDKDASRTACPSPASWLEMYGLEGNVIALTISRNLSGSHNSAMAALDMAKETMPDKNIDVVDSWCTGPTLNMVIEEICRCIKAGMSFEEVVKTAQDYASNTETVFTLCSFNNLVKNGRMSPFVGFVAQKLGFWGIGIKSPMGTIVIKGKVRGMKKAMHGVVEDIVERGGNVSRICITHCQNLEAAEMVKAAAQEKFPDAFIDIGDTRGLCSFYAERHGVIVSYR